MWVIETCYASLYCFQQLQVYDQLACAAKLGTAASYTTLGLAQTHQPIKYHVEAPSDSTSAG